MGFRQMTLKLKQKKYTVTVSWKKVKGRYYSVVGYQICYSTSKKWKGKKQKLFRKNKATVTNLKKKKVQNKCSFCSVLFFCFVVYYV